MKPPFLFRIRTVTAFLSLQPQDFPLVTDTTDQCQAADKIAKASQLVKTVQSELTQAGYEVQTVRIATNPFGEWVTTTSKQEHDIDMETAKARLQCLNRLLDANGITFCAVGPATSVAEIEALCATIVETCPYVSCSATVAAGDVEAARATARCIQQIASIQIDGAAGLGNFRFCGAAATCQPGIPFFPVAKAASEKSETIKFALGLENGPLARHWLSQAASIANIATVFKDGMAEALRPIQELCQKVAAARDNSYSYDYLGIDTSLNPSLDAEGGSVAEAIECLQEVQQFGGPGTLAAAAAITTALQSLPGIQLTGYCGLMLPVCEDQRLAQLAAVTAGDTSSNSQQPRQLQITDLLSISSVCGVGIDTVPLAGNVSEERLTALLLDVAGLAARWNKPLSCRVLPFEGKEDGDMTDFDSPYMVNTRVFTL